MFTGIIEAIGTCKIIDKDTATGGCIMTISNASTVLQDAQLGDSIAVNGTCLTVTAMDKDQGWFTVGLAPETLRRTNLGDLKVNENVNLERSMGSNSRFGGHFVQGHVDGTCKILQVRSEKDSIWYQLSIPAGFETLVVSKGYVALDGTSLTVCEVNLSDVVPWFEIMLVPYTQEHVIMPKKKIGDLVNFEADVMGKYVAQSIGAALQQPNSSLAAYIKKVVKEMITAEE